MDADAELDDIFNSGINVSIQMLEDCTFEVRYGNYIHGQGHFQSNFATFEEAVKWLKRAVESRCALEGLTS
jgi:hypothetical protein